MLKQITYLKINKWHHSALKPIQVNGIRRVGVTAGTRPHTPGRALTAGLTICEVTVRTPLSKVTSICHTLTLKG